MSLRQLTVVVEIEQKKENKLASDFQQAKQHLDMNQQKLDGVQQYRLEYMQQLHEKATVGIEGNYYSQYQEFVKKLEAAAEQQVGVIATAKKVVEQRKQLWLQQQQKRKAVELLIEKYELELLAKQNKAEQQLLDEFATNQFFRRSTSLM